MSSMFKKIVLFNILACVSVPVLAEQTVSVGYCQGKVFKRQFDK